MATRNIAENKRFVYRLPDKKPITYLVSPNGSRIHRERKIFQSPAVSTPEVLPSPSSPPPPSSSSLQTSITTDTSRADVTSARRVVVIRNTKNPQMNRKPVDLDNLEQPESMKIPPVISNGVSVLLIN